MKKVLIITNLFHSSPRIPGLSKYLPEFGWEPVVLATPLGENPEARLGPPNDFTKRVRTIEVPYKDPIPFLKRLGGFGSEEGSRVQLEKRFGKERGGIVKPILRKLIIWAGAIIAYPDEMRWWRTPAVRTASAMLRKEHFDAILTSSSPVTSHRIAKELVRRFRLPWAADMRDLWTQNHNYLHPAIRKFFETRLEMRTLSAADAFTTVSEPLVAHLKSRYPGTPATSIPNGFDPEKVNEPPIATSKEFSISYTGTIYPEKQDHAKILDALRELIMEDAIDPSRTKLRFYGVPQPWLRTAAEARGLGSVVEQPGMRSRTEIGNIQKWSQVLLVFAWEDPKETGVLPTKLYEYFAARRPILVTGGTTGERFREMLDEAKAGSHPMTVQEIKKVLLAYYEEYVRTGSVSYRGDARAMDRYSYRSMANEFAKVLDGVVAGRI